MGDIHAINVAGSETVLSEKSVDDFCGKQRGPVLRDGDAEYDAGRAVWNARIDRRPALIARCTGVSDVMHAVDFARAHTLPISVLGGGHNIAGVPFATRD